MSFDRVARVYRGLERLVYGDALQRSRVEHLGGIEARRVLLLGDGDGRFLEALLGEFADVEVDVVEASGRMIEVASGRVGDDPRVVFHQVEIEDFEADGLYDLVASHFFLDCFEEDGVKEVVGKVSGCLRDGGVWLVSDFQMPERGFFRRLRARVLLWVMYRFFALCSGLRARRLVDPEGIILMGGFRLGGRVDSNAGFLRADWWVR